MKVGDPDVDLVYIATPHSHHYDVTKAAIEAGKPCLVEKAFMANARQTKEILDLARQHRVFLAEAIWTRYQPVVGIVRKLIADGLLEPREMPHAETLYIMKLMDGLRAKWDVRYPMD